MVLILDKASWHTSKERKNSLQIATLLFVVSHGHPYPFRRGSMERTQTCKNHSIRSVAKVARPAARGIYRGTQVRMILRNTGSRQRPERIHAAIHKDGWPAESSTGRRTRYRLNLHKKNDRTNSLIFCTYHVGACIFFNVICTSMHDL